MAFNFTLDNDQGASLDIPALPCETPYSGQADEFGYPVDPTQTCGCDVCDKSCGDIDWKAIIPAPTIFTGMKVNSIFLIVFITLLTVTANYWGYYRKQKKTRARNDSIDSYERIKEDLQDG